MQVFTPYPPWIPVAFAQERFYYRFLAGPQNRLTWALDPELGDAWALATFVCGLLMILKGVRAF